MDKFDIGNILQIEELTSELDFERASALQLKLRWMVKKDESLRPIRDHLRLMIKNYENQNWFDIGVISQEEINESEKAEVLVSSENRFIFERRKLIRNKLAEYGLKQSDLANILGHRSNYMSELMNGVRSFSKDDIVIIHRLLKIKLDFLIFPFVKDEVARHIKSTLFALNNSKIKLSKKDLDFTLA